MNNKHKFLLNKEIYIKPPIGVMPKEIWKWHRAKELSGAIRRYSDKYMKIPIEWVEEYNELVKSYEHNHEEANNG